MDLSKLFFIGATGYFLSGLFDVAILCHKSILAKFLYIGFFITAIPYPILFFTYSSPLLATITVILLLFIGIFTLLLIYSVLLEIPFFGTNSGKLYRKGTYKISRHPGFIWYTAINLLVAWYFWNLEVTLLCAGLTLCNLVLIAIEDMVLFPKMFPEYADYKKQTPFFLLHKNSVTRSSKK
jgi:protein-S-isoprenylcysteine O-methyltransferase Ste14